MSQEFLLSRKEFSAIQKFLENHNHANIFILKYTGTGIGIHTDIICDKCQKEDDITDYKSW